MKYIFTLLLMLPIVASTQQRYLIFFANKGANAAFDEPAQLIGSAAAGKRLKAGIGTYRMHARLILFYR